MHPLHRKYLFAFLSCGPLFALDRRLRRSGRFSSRIEDRDAFVARARIREIALHCIMFWIEAEHYKFSVTHSEASQASQLGAGRGGKRFESGLAEGLTELGRLRRQIVARKLESMRGAGTSSSTPSSSSSSSSSKYGGATSSSRGTISAHESLYSGARDRSSAFYNTDEFAMRTVGTDSSELLDLEPVFHIPSKRQDRAQDDPLRARIELREDVRETGDKIFEEYLGQEAKRSIKGLMPQLHGDKTGAYRALCAFQEEARSWKRRRRIFETQGSAKGPKKVGRANSDGSGESRQVAAHDESSADELRAEKGRIIKAFRQAIKSCDEALTNIDADADADIKWAEQRQKQRLASDALPETRAPMGRAFHKPQEAVWEHVIKVAFADFVDKCWCRRRRLFLYECPEFGLPLEVLTYHDLRDAVCIHFRNIPKSKAHKLALGREKEEGRRLDGGDQGAGGGASAYQDDLPILAENTVQIAVAPME